MIAHLVKQKLAQVDVDHLWENTLPEVAASKEQLESLERRIGYSLHPMHREFLLHANGWRAFKSQIDVLSVEDLIDGDRAVRVLDLIESLEPLVNICGLQKNDLMPIAVSSSDIDVFMIAGPHTEVAGKVFWFAGGLVDTFENFDEWFLAMVEYIKEDYRIIAGNNVVDG